MHENLIDNLTPPNSDVFYVKNDLNEILVFFKKYEISTFSDVFVREKVHEINKQGLEFHDCLQKSIAQSNKLENHAESVIGYIKVLEDPVFNQNRVLNILRNLLENTRENMEETQQIKDKYKEIKDNLTDIHNQYYENNMNNEISLKSLPQKKEELRNLEKDDSKITNAVFTFIAGFIFQFYGAVVGERNLGGPVACIACIACILGGTIMFMSVLTGMYYKAEGEARIRELRKEIRVLENLKEVQILTKSEIDMRELCKKITSILHQMGTFHTYWEDQYNILDGLNKSNNLQSARNNICSEQDRKLLVGPIKDRWEKVKVQCDNYTKTVRNIIKQTQALEN